MIFSFSLSFTFFQLSFDSFTFRSKGKKKLSLSHLEERTKIQLCPHGTDETDLTLPKNQVRSESKVERPSERVLFDSVRLIEREKRRKRWKEKKKKKTQQFNEAIVFSAPPLFLCLSTQGSAFLTSAECCQCLSRSQFVDFLKSPCHARCEKGHRIPLDSSSPCRVVVVVVSKKKIVNAQLQILKKKKTQAPVFSFSGTLKSLPLASRGGDDECVRRERKRERRNVERRRTRGEQQQQRRRRRGELGPRL